MVEYAKAKLTLPPADVDNDGQPEVGTFVFESNVTIALETRTGRLGNNKLGRAVDVITDYIDGEDGGTGGKRKTAMLDLGTGEHVCTIDFSGYEGGSYQWGNTGEGGTAADSTGEKVGRQLELLDRYLQVCEIDSRPGHEATLEVGNYSSEGYYSPLVVAPEQPRVEFDATEQSSEFDGSLTFVEIASLGNPIDAQSRNTR